MKNMLFAVCFGIGAVLLASVPAGATDPMSDSAPAGYYVFQKVVYQNDGGLPDDRAYFERLARNIGAHIAATEGKVEIRVVSFSGGVKAFQLAKSDAALAASIDGLRAKGVRFLICRNTLKAMGLGPDDLGVCVYPSVGRPATSGIASEHPGLIARGRNLLDKLSRAPAKAFRSNAIGCDGEALVRLRIGAISAHRTATRPA